MFATDARCYLEERVLNLRVVLVWLLVLVGVLVTTADPLSQLLGLAIITVLFILAFRLWDDLADLEHDRKHRPERCLTRVQNLWPFHALLWLTAAVVFNLLLLLAGEKRALCFLAMVAIFAVSYRLTEGRPALRPLRVLLVLAKYPTFVLLLADEPLDGSSVLVALGVFIPPLVDEVRSAGPDILLPAATFFVLVAIGWLSLKI